ncbi:YciI family protein [Paraburkholderia sp. GAS334]|uniref:YciI family protein n=1 Tax=Paraburkholderia sp. GAS334 TaxID=3035131 RepID=UPI003D260F05
MEFVLAFQQPPNVYETYADLLKGQQVSLAWKQYMGALTAAGVMRAGTQLDPRNASTVRMRHGQRQVQDGPSPEAHALFGGFVAINVETQAEALHWAELSPSSSAGYTEVIPVLPIIRA